MKKYRKNNTAAWIAILLCVVAFAAFFAVTIKSVKGAQANHTHVDDPGPLSAEQEITVPGKLTDAEEKCAESNKNRTLELIAIDPKTAESIGEVFARVSRLYPSDAMPMIASITEEESEYDYLTLYQIVDCDRHVFFFHIISGRVAYVMTEDSSNIYLAPIP